MFPSFEAVEDIYESGRLALGKRSAVSKPEVKHFFFLTHYLLINKNSNQSIKFSGSRMKNAMKCSIVLKRTTTETLIMGSLPKSSNTAKKMTEFYTGELNWLNFFPIASAKGFSVIFLYSSLCHL